MRWSPVLWLLCTVLIPGATGTALGQTAGVKLPQVQRLEDGSELVVLHAPNATWASVRFMVGAGGADDPPGKSGLAHLLAHLIMRGSYTVDGNDLRGRVSAAGGTLQAVTTSDQTVFSLDAPAAVFEPLARDLVRMVTNPAVGLRDLAVERGLIQTEEIRPADPGSGWWMDQTVFSALTRGQTVLGASATRETITRDDVKIFMGKHCVPANTTVVMAGPLSLEQARAVVLESSALPPVQDATPPATRSASLTLPLEHRMRSPITAAVFGYQVDNVEPQACRDMALLLTWRLQYRLQMEKPLAGGVKVGCYTVQGNMFMLAVAMTRNPQMGLVPEVMKETFEQARQLPPSAKERRVIADHFTSVLGDVGRDPRAWADTVVHRTLAMRKGAIIPFGALVDAPSLRPNEMVDLARSAFQAHRQVLIHLSPFEG